MFMITVGVFTVSNAFYSANSCFRLDIICVTCVKLVNVIDMFTVKNVVIIW